MKKSYDRRKPYFPWTEAYQKKHFQTKDFYINNDSRYTQIMWLPGKQNLYILKESHKNIFESEI